MTDLNLRISIAKINVNVLNIPIKNQRLQIEKAKLSDTAFKILVMNIMTQTG
jgi:hypothetical protein